MNKKYSTFHIYLKFEIKKFKKFLLDKMLKKKKKYKGGLTLVL
jgi:hypothetical protein